MSPELAPPIIKHQEDIGLFNQIRDTTVGWRAKIGRIIATSLLVAGSTTAAYSVEVVDPTLAMADTGDYPWGDAPHVPQPPATDNITWGYTNKTDCDNKSASFDCRATKIGNYYFRDHWGYDLRNCTSYVAWRVARDHGVDPSEMGHAKYWDDKAVDKGWTVDNTPEVGDIAQWDTGGGGFGHVAIVERVNADGSVYIAEHNRGLDGNFGHRDNMRAEKYIDLNGTGTGGSSTPPPPPPRPTTTNTTGWIYENLEGDAGSVIPHVANTGKDPAAVEFNGQFYVFSYDEENGNLRMDSTRPNWGSTVLDGDPGSVGGRNANTGKNPAAVVYANALHVFYYDQSDGDLRHAWSANGMSWQTEPLDGHATGNGRSMANVGGTPTAVVWGDSLQVFYRDTDNTNLKHAWATPQQGWRFETLDGDPGSVSGRDGNVGLDPSAVVWNGTLALFYRDEGNQRLRHSYVTATQGWQFAQLDGDPGSICHSPYMNTGSNPSAVVHDNQVHVFSYDSTGGNLRHARVGTDTGGWICETLDGDSGSAIGNNKDIGAMPAAASIGGTLQLFAYQPEHGGLHHYWSGANGWQNENFDGFGGSPSGRVNHPTGLEPVVASYNGTPHVFYYDHTGGNLRHARPN